MRSNFWRPFSSPYSCSGHVMSVSFVWDFSVCFVSYFVTSDVEEDIFQCWLKVFYRVYFSFLCSYGVDYCIEGFVAFGLDFDVGGVVLGDGGDAF